MTATSKNTPMNPDIRDIAIATIREMCSGLFDAQAQAIEENENGFLGALASFDRHVETIKAIRVILTAERAS